MSARLQRTQRAAADDRRRSALPPIRYASSAGSSMSHNAMSARCPTASVPRSARPSARAALRVTPASASRGVSRNSVHAMFIISGSDVAGDVPGLQSVAIAIGTPCARSAVERRQPRLAQRIERARQQHGDRAGARHRGDARLVRVFEMVGRQRAELGGKRRAVRVGELVGVQLDRQAVRARRVEHARASAPA